MGSNEELVCRQAGVGRKMTPKLGGGSGMSDVYIFTKKSQMKGKNSYQERQNQRSIIENKATFSPS